MGSGQCGIEPKQMTIDTNMPATQPCPECRGTGLVPVTFAGVTTDFECPKCGGAKTAQIKPHEITRELRLKLALANLLADDIEITGLANFRWRYGPYAGEILRSTEWDYVVRRIVASDEYESTGCTEPAWIHEAEQILERLGIEWDK